MLLALLSLVAFLAAVHPVIDWLANFRGVYVICALVAVPALLKNRRALALVPLVVAINAVSLAPWFTGQKQTCDTQTQALSINALHNGSDHDKLVEQILADDPDIVFICELEPELEAKVARLFPHKIWSDEYSYVALFSKYPVEGHEYILSPWGRPHINATLLTPRGTLRVIGAHTTAPYGTDQSLDRNATLLQLADAVRESDEPVIVLGDLNITMFSPHYEPLEDAGLRNARLGRGVQPTWPSFSPIRIPIDHVMHTEELEVCDLEVGDSFGSDHLPLLAGLAWRPQVVAAIE